MPGVAGFIVWRRAEAVARVGLPPVSLPFEPDTVAGRTVLLLGDLAEGDLTGVAGVGL
jgi:hypothetical protein